MNDASVIGAMTWAEIVGEANVMDVSRPVSRTRAPYMRRKSCRLPEARYPTSSVTVDLEAAPVVNGR